MTLPVLVAILGTIGGILVVGVGGGLIKPMQQRWENYLDKAEREGRNMREHLDRRSSDGSTQQLPAYSSAQSGGAPGGYTAGGLSATAAVLRGWRSVPATGAVL